MKRILSAAILLAALAVTSYADNLRFAAGPSLSPDGSTIYFAYNGDIFSVPATGGTATGVVTMAGYEYRPLVSPDGKYLAFCSTINGNADVFVLETGSGEVRQLTFHQAQDKPVCWSSDSKYIYFETNRTGAIMTTYKVSVDGGTPEALFDGYFTTVVNLVENPVSGEFYFNESTESVNFPTRKRYVGDHNPDIKSYNPATGEYRQLTSYIGKDTWPMVDNKGNLYYVCDESNKESNIVQYISDGKYRQLTNFDRSVQWPRISFDGSAIVYLLDYQIHVLNPATGEDKVPQITLASGNLDLRRSFDNQKPSVADVSPDGKKFAFIIRGGLYISDAKGKYLQKLSTPQDERVREILWGKDNKTVYFTRTQEGVSGLYCISADNTSPEVKLYGGDKDVANITLSHKGDKIAFLDGNRDLMVFNTGSKTASKIAEAEFWSFHSYPIIFSGDDSHIAFMAMNKFETDIYVYSFKDGKLNNLTNSASPEDDVVFSPDGKYMFLTANPTGTSFPRGARSYLYRLPLRKYDKQYKSDAYDKLFDEKKPAKDSTVVIDYEDVFDRMERMERQGGQRGLYIFEAKDKTLLLYTTSGDSGSEVMALDINDPEAKPKAIKGLRWGQFFNSDKDLFFLSNGKVSKIDPNSLSTTDIDISVNVEKELGDEFREMFYECWAVLGQNFYDVNFHGADWNAVKEYYSSLLPYVTSRSQLRNLVNDMLGELNSSHMGFSSSGPEEDDPTNIRTAFTGIVFDNDSPYVVKSIVKNSPADKVDIDIAAGDELVAVNGDRTDPSLNREQYLSSPVTKDELRLTFRRGTKEFTTKVHTTSFQEYRKLQYAEWEDQRKAMVEEKSDGRIAYIHMRAMSDDDLNNFLTKMHTYADNKDALILDLRYNNGGNVHQEVIDFLSRRQHFEWSHRDFPKVTHPNVIPGNKPVVVLVNEHSLSDAEVTSNGIKTLGLAKIVGTETYRWIIFTSSVRLIDGSSVRMPAWGCYNNLGEDLESVGVKPDIYVRNTFKDRITGADPQLDAAVEEVMRQLGKN